MLNTDAFIDSATLDAMLALLDAHPEIGVAGPTLIYPDGSPQVSHESLPTLRSEVLSLFGLEKVLRPPRSTVESPRKTGESEAIFVLTGTVEGASMIARRDALDKVGLFDESYFFFNEEVDLCFLIQQVGWKVAYIPDTRVVHVRGASTGIVPRRVLLLYRGKLQYFEKHHGRDTRDRLFGAMLIATYLKILGYCLVRLVSLGRVRKDELWREVHSGLKKLDQI